MEMIVNWRCNIMVESEVSFLTQTLTAFIRPKSHHISFYSGYLTEVKRVINTYKSVKPMKATFVQDFWIRGIHDLFFRNVVDE